MREMGFSTRILAVALLSAVAIPAPAMAHDDPIRRFVNGLTGERSKSGSMTRGGWHDDDDDGRRGSWSRHDDDDDGRRGGGRGRDDDDDDGGRDDNDDDD